MPFLFHTAESVFLRLDDISSPSRLCRYEINNTFSNTEFTLLLLNNTLLKIINKYAMRYLYHFLQLCIDSAIQVRTCILAEQQQCVVAVSLIVFEIDIRKFCDAHNKGNVSRVITVLNLMQKRVHISTFTKHHIYISL